MKSYIHVNRQKIVQNKKNGTNEPTITCKTYKSNTYAHEIVILDKDNNEVARIIHRPDKPLSCGAKVWIETSNQIKIIR